MLYQKEIYKLIIAILASIFFCGCKYSPSYDVYSKLPKRSPLTKEVFLKSTQIIRYDSDIILTYNTCPDCWDRNDTHLLIYDKNLNLVGACFFSSGKIENIENGIITGYLNEDRLARSSSYRKDLPSKYSLKLIKWDSGSGIKSDRIIQKIVICTDSMKVNIITKKCVDNIFAGIDVINGKSKLDSKFLDGFTKIDTVNCKISDLLLGEYYISVKAFDSRNYLINDIMIPVDKSILTEFYEQIWKQLKSSSH